MSNFDNRILTVGVECIQDDNLIKGARINRCGHGNMALVIFIEDAKVTLKGLQYLHDNSDTMKTYNGLKEVKSWIPFVY